MLPVATLSSQASGGVLVERAARLLEFSDTFTGEPPVLRIRQNRSGPQVARVGTERQVPQVGLERQARHRANDACRAVLRRFRRVATVRPAGACRSRFRVSSFAFCPNALPILFLPTQITDGTETTKGFASDRKFKHMPFRMTTLALLTSGLIVAAGVGAGCQSQRGFRSAQARVTSPWRRAAPQASTIDEPLEYEEDAPQLRDAQRSRDTQRSFVIPPQPEIPFAPAVDADVSPQARHWTPARTDISTTPVPGLDQASESDDFGLPPARVTYNTTESTTDSSFDESITAPPPVHTSSSQPRLFRPAGTTRNMFDSMKRKLSWTEE